VNKILVGTKCDLESRREVTSEEGKGLAKEYNIPFIETSAKEGTNVEEAFLTIATAVKDRLIADGFVPGRYLFRFLTFRMFQEMLFQFRVV
jgi:Fe2+ transport system protein B